MKQQSYVYAFYDPCGDQPFYIGKGVGDRIAAHFRPSMLARKSRFYCKLKSLIAAGTRPRVEILHEGLTDREAVRIERDLIARYGRLDTGTGCLLNHTDGGEGLSGHVPSRETVEKRAAKLRGKKRSDEAIRKTAESQRGRKLPEWQCRLIGALKRGTKHSPETRRKMSEAKQGKKLTAEHCENISKGQKGRHVPPEWRAKFSAAHGGRPVEGVNPVTGEVQSYPYLNAVKGAGYSAPHVHACCNGTRRSHKGLLWRFVA